MKAALVKKTASVKIKPSAAGLLVAHFDPLSGASGDMILGALIDAGAPIELIESQLRTLPLPPFELVNEETRRQGFRARRIEFKVPEQKTHRHLSEIERILEGGDLPDAVRHDSLKIFRRLADAEGRVHGIPASKVHFHEVGALDSILDIVGCVAAVHSLSIQKITFSDLHDGAGSVMTAHGELPIPVPAVLELTRGLPIVRVNVRAELLTPTGAAFLITLGHYQPTSTLRAEKIGVSAGSREIAERANLLRVTIGREKASSSSIWWQEDQVEVLETNLDDMSPEVLAEVSRRAFDLGALDVFIVPCLMKKGRPGHLLTVLSPPEIVHDLISLLLRETTTFGIRRRSSSRAILRRAHSEVPTQWGPVRIKIGDLGTAAPRIVPELDSCREISVRSGASLQDVFDEVREQIRQFEYDFPEQDDED
jgi:uncharacterized protein (TIGR00299 family) protein